jgi:3-dehydroquinate synthase
VVYDENVAWAAGEVMDAVPVKGAFGLETSEELKTLETVQALCRQLMEADASRKAFLLAVGGGITTDLTGFAAAIYKRGIRYANLPTTLLAQVDAAIGGKTGVNLDGYKNMLGAFRMPEFTFLCEEVLKTLPPREFRAGKAEVLKTFLIGDAQAYEKALTATQWQPLITRAAEIKADIVRQDPEEHSIRAKLNLGHTFGHAIEHEAQEREECIHHGEAVAMGMILAARLAERKGLAKKGLEASLTADFEAAGLPTECPYPLDILAQAMEKDKKAAGGRIKWILPLAPGQVEMVEMTVKEAMDDLR